jgi:hypothetical protein
MGLRVDGRDELPMRAAWKRTPMVMNLRLSALGRRRSDRESVTQLLLSGK